MAGWRARWLAGWLISRKGRLICSSITFVTIFFCIKCLHLVYSVDDDGLTPLPGHGCSRSILPHIHAYINRSQFVCVAPCQNRTWASSSLLPTDTVAFDEPKLTQTLHRWSRFYEIYERVLLAVIEQYTF